MARPNLSKKNLLNPSQPSQSSFDLSKKNLLNPSQGNPEFDAAKKPGESLNNIKIGAKREIGSIGGITIEARAEADLSSLLPTQGITVSRDESKNTLSIGAGLGSTRGKLGVNIGAEITNNPDGSIEVSQISGGINVAGFGIEGSAGKGGKIGGAISVFGLTIDTAKDELGGISGGISIRLPGGSIGIGFQPDQGIEILVTPTPIAIPTLPPGALTPGQIDTGLLTSPCGNLCVTLHNHFESDMENPYVTGTEGICLKPRQVRSSATGNLTNETITSWDSEYIDEVWDDEARYSLKDWDEIFKIYSIGTDYDYYTISPATRAKCFPNPISSPQLPNYPQNIKPMDCCTEVKEIYKYLGIAKLKKNKFPVSNAFLVPGGKGNDECVDYYAITQALFRMLANGLIINPKSKPLGSEWQNANATAWAG